MNRREFIRRMEEIGYKVDLSGDRITVFADRGRRSRVLYVRGLDYIPPGVTFNGDFINLYEISFWDIPKDTEFDGIQKAIINDFRTDESNDFDIEGIDSMRLFKLMVKRLGA